MPIRTTEQSAEKKRKFVKKVIALMEEDGLTVTEANAVPYLLEWSLKRNSERVGANQKFTVSNERN